MGKRTNTAVWMEKYSRWQIKVQKDGERKTFTSSTPGRTGQREANARADAWLDDNIAPTKLRIEAIYDEWIETKKSTCSKGYWTSIDYRFHKWVIPDIGHKKIEKINEQDLQNIIDAAAKSGLARKSLGNILADMRAFFRYCRMKKLTTFDPEFVAVPKSARKNQTEILQPASLVKLLTVDTVEYYGKRVQEPYINAFRFQAVTGLRPGEIRGLMWQDIDLKQNNVAIQRSINKLDEVTRGKNDNAVRGFKLNPLSRSFLLAQRLATGNTIYVFDIESTESYNNRLQNYCESNGIPKVTAYELRHTFVSVVKQLPEGQLKELLGHAQDMDTFGIYGHELSGDKQRIADSVYDIFNQLLSSGL